MSSLFYPRGYGERQKIHGGARRGPVHEVFLTPQNLGGGIFSRVVVAGRSTLHVTDTLFGPRLKHLFFFLTYGSPYVYPPRNGGLLHKHLHFNWPTSFVATITSACAQYAILRGFLPRFTLGKRYSAATSLVSHVLCRVRCQKLGKTLGRQ